MQNQPLSEVFGFPIDNTSQEAKRHRTKRLCRYNNKVPSCTKDKASDPLGVCSVFTDGETAITCPVRFRQDWIIADDAASFFFGASIRWTTLTEVRLNDANGKSAGNIDLVIVSYNDKGRILDFGALEVQAVYISGNVRKPFEYFMSDPERHQNMDWVGRKNYPSPDYLSSSRKRLAPQLLFKGGILHTWNKKMCVAIDKGFLSTLPTFREVPQENAEMAWLVYDLKIDKESNIFNLARHKTIYTKFEESLEQVTKPKPGDVQEFVDHLQEKLDEKIDNGTPPDVVTIDEEF